MTNEELQNAYEITQAAEKELLIKVEDLIKKFKSDLAKLRNDQPEGGSQSAARQYLGRVESAIVPVSSYDLDTVKNGYGIVTQAQPTMVAPTTL